MANWHLLWKPAPKTKPIFQLSAQLDIFQLILSLSSILHSLLCSGNSPKVEVSQPDQWRCEKDTAQEGEKSNQSSSISLPTQSSNHAITQKVSSIMKFLSILPKNRIICIQKCMWMHVGTKEQGAVPGLHSFYRGAYL